LFNSFAVAFGRKATYGKMPGKASVFLFSRLSEGSLFISSQKDTEPL
jgi:hypothetical protein